MSNKSCGFTTHCRLHSWFCLLPGRIKRFFTPKTGLSLLRCSYLKFVKKTNPSVVLVIPLTSFHPVVPIHSRDLLYFIQYHYSYRSFYYPFTCDVVSTRLTRIPDSFSFFIPFFFGGFVLVKLSSLVYLKSL